MERWHDSLRTIPRSCVRAVRMVAEVKGELPVGVGGDRRGRAEAGHRQLGDAAEVDLLGRVDGWSRPGMTSQERAEIRRLKREVAELRRANEILKAASVSSRPSSTGHTRVREIHQRAQGPRRRRAPVESRADLRGLASAGLPDRPVHVLRGGVAAALAAGAAGRTAEGRDHASPRREPRRLRSPESMAAAEPGRHRDGPVHHRAADARAGPGRRAPRQEDPDHHPGTGRGQAR